LFLCESGVLAQHAQRLPEIEAGFSLRLAV